MKIKKQKDFFSLTGGWFDMLTIDVYIIPITTILNWLQNWTASQAENLSFKLNRVFQKPQPTT